jgi:transcriptional regulator with XRE-family HTH domain
LSTTKGSSVNNFHEKGCQVPRINNLKKLIREKQAKHREQTGQNLPQHAIATYTGIDPATLSEYMNDKLSTLNWEVWQKLANYLGVSGDEIFNVLPDEVK